MSRLLEGEEVWLAARAVFALSRVADAPSLEELRAAISSPHEQVRIAAARVAGRLPADTADSMLPHLLVDDSVGVRKFAVTSVSDRSAPTVRESLRRVADDPEPMLRRIAKSHEQSLRQQ